MKTPHVVWSNPIDPAHELVHVACTGTTKELHALLERRRRSYPRLVPVQGRLATWRWQEPCVPGTDDHGR
jgi:hypothetical protein